jgi:transcriptional regulator with XRE-family HTH domain
MGAKQEVIDASGMLSQADLAKQLGVTPGRISQIVNEIKDEVGIPAKGSLMSVQLADKADGLELKVMEAFEQKLPLFMIGAKPLELIKCVALLNGLKRRAGGVAGAGDNVPGITVNDNRVVQLAFTMPQNRPEIITDSRTGQIIESGGRTLVTASKEQILTRLEAPEIQEKVNGLLETERINAASAKYSLLPA